MRYLVVLLLVITLVFATLTIICAAPPSHAGSGQSACQYSADAPASFAALRTIDIAVVAAGSIIIPLILLSRWFLAAEHTPARLLLPPLLPPPRVL